MAKKPNPFAKAPAKSAPAPKGKGKPPEKAPAKGGSKMPFPPKKGGMC